MDQQWFKMAQKDQNLGRGMTKNGPEMQWLKWLEEIQIDKWLEEIQIDPNNMRKICSTGKVCGGEILKTLQICAKYAQNMFHFAYIPPCVPPPVAVGCLP